ncbi:MAG: ABC transporter substrate-binding protein, partial [Chloroflexota bacterium]
RFQLSQNGETITFFLREEIFCSVGNLLTANDVVFTWDAINTDSVASPRRANFSAVDRWTPVGDFSVEVSLAQVDCAALLDVGSVSILPAHAYANDPENIVDSPENNGPTVVSGPFTFLEYVPESVVRLAANPNYYLGRPNIDTWTYRVYPDQSAEFAGFLAGEIDYIDVPPENVSVLEDAIASGQSFRNDRFFSDGYAYVGFNLANPENPQPGFEDLNGDGTFTRGEPPLEQDPHPVLSDVAVRKAIASAVDYTGIINQVIYGQGAPTAANVLPSIGWAYNADLELPVTDTELAAQILADAGWAPGDSTNDAGLPILEKEGQALTLILMTNQGATARENIVALLKEQLDELGFDIQLEITEFGTVVQKLLGQEFDMILLGWVGLGPEPDDSSFFSYENDEPGAGFNFVSYYNETFEANLKAGKAVPGCAEADRMPFYKANQAIFREDQPYVPLYIPLINSASALRLNGFEPNTWDPDGDFNIQDWTITP